MSVLGQGGCSKSCASAPLADPVEQVAQPRRDAPALRRSSRPGATHLTTTLLRQRPFTAEHCQRALERHSMTATAAIYGSDRLVPGPQAEADLGLAYHRRVTAAAVDLLTDT
jgi:hypothetical protein